MYLNPGGAHHNYNIILTYHPNKSHTPLSLYYTNSCHCSNCRNASLLLYYASSMHISGQGSQGEWGEFGRDRSPYHGHLGYLRPLVRPPGSRTMFLLTTSLFFWLSLAGTGVDWDLFSGFLTNAFKSTSFDAIATSGWALHLDKIIWAITKLN